MTINLNECVVGDRLVSRHGQVLTYIGKSGNVKWPHLVEYSNGSCGTRTNDGYVYANPAKRLPEDHDIVEILPLPVTQPKHSRVFTFEYDPESKRVEAAKLVDLLRREISGKFYDAIMLELLKRDNLDPHLTVQELMDKYEP